MVSFDDLLQAGVHFGHLTRKWHPAMAPYIFTEKNNIHIIDLLKTQKMLDEACQVTKQLTASGRKIMFVGTKKQAKEILEKQASSVHMPFVTERWLGGMLTNFATVRKSVKKLQSLEKMELDGTAELLQKKERLMKARERAKLDKLLKGIAEMRNLPGALFIVDVKKEHIAVAEARRLNIPTIGLVDTNSNPNVVDFPIAGNDDAAKSIDLITSTIVAAIKEGLADRRANRELEESAGEEEAPAPTTRSRKNAPVAETVEAVETADAAPAEE